MNRFKSIYAPYIKDFINYKKMQGYKLKGVEYRFVPFDKLCIEREERILGITQELSDIYCKFRENESGKTRYYRMNFFISFAKYLNSIGINSYVPNSVRVKNTFIPYIFTKEEMQSIFTACDTLFKIRYPAPSAINIIPALFRLLYGTGVRISEALALKDRDLDTDNHHIIVRNTKNGKDRMLPITESLAVVCSQYRKYRNLHLFDYTQSDYFFLKGNNTPCSNLIAYNWFRKILEKAGISHGGRNAGPRLHDLRHTFSVHSLMAMSEKDLDLYYSLPILSTYLGHQTIEATGQYIRLTSEMYPHILKDVHNISGHIFPNFNDITI
ncbi:MAG: tyrosine-type recombinase/integrase [Proteiniphilum sp.]|uniref:tyrosine-type recombinase/integrase n=1 Tax=Proteiniphilum sp. TaxID=1926877 RepID=UPI002B201CDE|nr:tyrosine-type recombinase/integrase [Proteiniphilum sp.]MEA5128306.1 tyrosine-type recombinase/integrase [Proteiniphilum sp.]